ncbi:MAG: hypothetical protein ISS15_09140 [Alphaproteobacteria bacterium]|nr:hypothetical protein [Alphaproteobacteria bacterium]MBL7097810.1 hypothetical protein [Alphaproteobacteria bacterium]
MTKDKFQVLCEQVLVPKVGDLLHTQLLELHGTLEIMAAELARIEQWMSADQDHAVEVQAFV